MPDTVEYAGLARELRQTMQRLRIPAVAIAVIDDRAVSWCATLGVADAGTGASVSPETVFEAASLSKPVFAYAVLGLCEDGLLALDRPLSSYLPEPYFEDEVNEPRIDAITARVVLRHTTGLPNWRTPPEPLALRGTPNARFGYSGEGYMYLQRVVEQVTRRALADVLQDRVLGPLGMARSSFRWRPDYEGAHATGHDAEGRPLPKWKPPEAMAAATLHTTAADYARFLLAMLEPAPSWLELMLRDEVTVGDGLAWGLGWGLERTERGPFFWHWGSQAGFRAFTCGDRQRGRALVILTNGERGVELCNEAVERVTGVRHPAFDFVRDSARFRL